MSRFAVLVVLFFIGTTVANVVPSVQKTACQLHRERELKSTSAAKLVPECDANGEYVSLACYDGENGSKFCSCFTKKGQVAKSPSVNVKRCDCHVERHEKINSRLIGGTIPRCEENGNYSKLQCSGSSGLCWCSNPDGKKAGEPTRNRDIKCE